MKVETGGKGTIGVGVFALGIADDELLAREGGVLEGVFGHAALAGFADLGEDVADADGMQTAEHGGSHHFGIVVGGVDDGQTAKDCETICRVSGDIGHGKRVLVTSDGTPCIVGFQGGIVKGGIADDEVVRLWGVVLLEGLQ